MARPTPIDNSTLDQLIADGSARPPLDAHPHSFVAPPARDSGPGSAEIIADVRGYERGY